MVQTRYTNRLREAPRLKNTQSQKPAEVKPKKSKYSYVPGNTKIRSWVRVYPESPIKPKKAGQKRQRRNSESALKTKQPKLNKVNSKRPADTSLTFKPVRVITDPCIAFRKQKTPRKSKSKEISKPVQRTAKQRGRSPVKKVLKVPKSKNTLPRSQSSTNLPIQKPLSQNRASSISSESENDSVFETSFTRGGFDLATNRWSFSPNPQPTQQVVTLRNNSRHVLEDEEEKSLQLALSKSNKSFQNSLNKIKKRRNRSLGQLFARTTASQPTIDDNSSYNSDDFDNDDIQGLRRRSKSCGQIPRVCPTPRQVSDQSSSMSHVVTNSQKSFQTVDNKSLKSAKLMRKEKTVLLLKKNRTVFAEREEPDFDSMNSFGPRGDILRRASKRDRHSQKVLSQIFQINEKFN